jgi:hypothetical protein
MTAPLARHGRGLPRLAPTLAPKRGWSRSDECSDLVGMAGFEPAASCSQSSPDPCLQVPVEVPTTC